MKLKEKYKIQYNFSCVYDGSIHHNLFNIEVQASSSGKDVNYYTLIVLNLLF